jgi:hemerythrin
MGDDVARSWNPKLKIGVGAIDVQHEELYDRFDAFVEAASDRDRKAAASQALAYLTRYVDEHFADEERSMADHRYPNLGAHRELHRSFSRELADLTARFFSQGATPSFLLALANLFESWLSMHISLVDQKYGEFLRERGGAPAP